MKTIGIIGGMSWESTAEYYRFLNQSVRERLGGYRSAPILLSSVDFGPIELRMREDRWDEVGDLIVREATRLERAGPDLLILATNSVHYVADRIEEAVSIPFLHIGDAAARAVQAAGIETIGLLGTRYTMEKAFLRDRLKRYGITALLPDEERREDVHRIIFEELVHGKFRRESRQTYLSVIEELHARGAQGIVLGCTEIEMLVKPGDTALPLFETARIHCRAAIDAAMKDE